MDEDLCITLRAKAVTGGLELLPQLAIVVDLAVLNDVNRPILVCDRLIARLEVDDREPSSCEGRVAVDQDSVAVRAAVHERLVHALDRCPLHAVVGRDDSADSAHT